MARSQQEIHGDVAPDFEPVREAFVENFSHRNELGAACCVIRDDQMVVNLWGGVRDGSTGQHWDRDTMVLVFSVTKGMSALAMAVADSRRLFDYEERVAAYWPEFAQAGKDAVTVRQLLAHQAGLFAIDESVAVGDWTDRQRVERRRTSPAPRERRADHSDAA